jgi:hypothetical protein
MFEYKIFGSIRSVGDEPTLEKECPLIHTGACIASLIRHVCAFN